MFCGLVKEIGKIITIQKNNNKTVFYIEGNLSYNNIKIDDSISVNGCCLTVTSIENNIAVYDILPETLKRTNFNLQKTGDCVNLEDSLSQLDKIGGHIVQGHIDCTAIIIDQKKEGDSIVTTFSIDKEYGKMLVPKGFIAIDGISLTIIDCSDNQFSVMLIPHTINKTIAKYWKFETVVNIEIDIINKSIWNYLQKLNRVKDVK